MEGGGPPEREEAAGRGDERLTGPGAVGVYQHEGQRVVLMEDVPPQNCVLVAELGVPLDRDPSLQNLCGTGNNQGLLSLSVTFCPPAFYMGRRLLKHTPGSPGSREDTFIIC